MIVKYFYGYFFLKKSVNMEKFQDEFILAESWNTAYQHLKLIAAAADPSAAPFLRSITK